MTRRSRNCFGSSLLQILAIVLLATGCGSGDSGSPVPGGSSIHKVPLSGKTSDNVNVTFECDIDYTLNDIRRMLPCSPTW